MMRTLGIRWSGVRGSTLDRRFALTAGAAALTLVLTSTTPASDGTFGGDVVDPGGWPGLVLDLSLPVLDSQALDFSGRLGAKPDGAVSGTPVRLSAAVNMPESWHTSRPGSRTSASAASLMRARIHELAGMSAQRLGIGRTTGIPTAAGGGALLATFDFNRDIALRRTLERSNAVVGRIDAAVLPFLDVYGLFGWTWGDLGEEMAPQDRTMYTPAAHVGWSQLDYQGLTYGGGGKLSGKWEQFFASVDTKFTLTDLDVADEAFKTFSIAPRVGAHTENGPVKGTFYLGAMYMTVDDDVKAGVDIPGLKGVPLQVDMDITKPWNMLVGTEIEIVENFVFSLEGGFLGRRQVVAGFGAKF
ncbi:MAG: hypothetical protein E4H03_10630 [Myxococcales bacterium]|nr:MAG: hypothetical protein E4H03_10630 [Myxococcales bacterium]